MPACCTPLKPEPSVSCCSANSSIEQNQPIEWVKIGFAALVAVQTMVLGLAVNITPPSGTTRWVLHSILILLTLAVFILAGGPILKESFRQARRGRVVMEQFFLIGIAGAFGASLYSTFTEYGSVYYEVVAVLIAIYTFGMIIGQYKRQEVFTATDALREEFSHALRIIQGGGEKEKYQTERVAVLDIQPGELILIPAGSGVPVDGIIVQGSGFVQETTLTGEPFPIVKRPMDSILASSYVIDQALIVRATASGKKRMLDTILTDIEKARLNPSSLQRFADRLTSLFLPIVLIVALAAWIGGTWAWGWIPGIFNALAVMVVACPCALGLATPLSIWNALGALARLGVVAHSGEWIEKVAKVDTVVFDKTGTLSQEELQLVDFITLEDIDRTELQRMVAQVQTLQSHPVARAFASWANLKKDGKESLSIQNPDSIQLKTISGIGIEAVIQNSQVTHTLRIGNDALLDPEDQEIASSLKKKIFSTEKNRAVESFKNLNFRIFWIKLDERLVAAASLCEIFRASSKPALAALSSMGVHLEVMTGDRMESAASIGELSSLESKKIHTQLTPDQKRERVDALQQKGFSVLFVGDGVNDAPAMSRAHAALAMDQGTALARQTSQATLYGGNLEQIHRTLYICRESMRIVRQNFIFALVYNSIGMSLAAFGILHPVVAAFLMLGSSLTVTFNALRSGQKLHTPLPQHSNYSTPSSRLPKKFNLPQTSKQRHPAFSTSFQPARAAFHPFNPLSLCAVTSGFSLGSIGPIFAWFFDLDPLSAWILTLITFLSGSLLTWVLSHKAPSQKLCCHIGTFCVGTFGMLIGWAIERNFRPLDYLENGICMPLFQSSSTLSLLTWLHIGWMDIGMIAGCLPWMFLRSTNATASTSILRRIPQIVFSIFAMLLGMRISLSLLSWMPNNYIKTQMILGFIAMILGMLFATSLASWLSSMHEKFSMQRELLKN